MPEKRTTRVRRHTRTTATGKTATVRSHNRDAAMAQAKAAWIGCGVSGLTTTALVVEFGLTLVSTIALVLTALLGWAAVWAGDRANKNKRRMQAAAKARKSTGRRTTAKRRR